MGVMRLKSFKRLNEEHIDKLILKTVKDMQPITAEDIWLELDENLGGELQMDLSMVEERLEGMENLEKLDLIRAENKKETFWKVKDK